MIGLGLPAGGLEAAEEPSSTKPGIGLASGAAAEAAREHWSFRPLRSASELAGVARSAAMAAGVRRAGELSPIDAFLMARLATNGLGYAPEAERGVWLRRVTFDLTGLPPSPEDVQRFVADRRPGARERVVEALLASPRHGERWGRHWLDVVRYTESQGFEYDKLRDNAWHYRDYVIASFNADKPYDRFMREQVAGDVLEPVSVDGMIGPSLLVCGPWDEAGSSQANITQRTITREEEMEDLVGTVGQTFLGLTLNCARCHDHKFDPISLEEYYRVKSVFDGVKHGERPLATSEQQRAREERVRTLKASVASARDEAARVEAEAWTNAVARRQAALAAAGGADGGAKPGAGAGPGPTPYWRWSFGAGGVDGPPGELKGGAVVRGGRLQLASAGAYFQSAPLPKDVREKTLEAWVALADRNQGGGAAISVETEDGVVFDAIVYGEREAGKWMAGSSGFVRTRDLEAPVEAAPAGTLLHLAAVYRGDGTVAVYRNGEPYGKPYRPGSPVQTYRAGKAHVLLGMRHQGGGRPWLTGEIQMAALHDRALGDDEVRAAYRSRGESVTHDEVLAAMTPAQRAAHAAALKRRDQLQAELDGIGPVPVSYVGTRVQPAPTRVFRRGDVKLAGDVVAASGLTALAVSAGLPADLGLAPEAPEAERRRRFAAWLSSPTNPLPARVMANRVWQFHFGQGLVGTPNDFGRAGARPTHPELLDWLASSFVESGWSVKALHRLILSSAAYAQGGTAVPAVARAAQAVDADNQMLWRFPARRLEAEAVRDAMLAVSGELNLGGAMGGPSFRPFEVRKFPANAYVPVDRDGAEYNRRTVYRMNVNSGKEPLLDAFDCPDPSVKTPRRGVTTTPLQALALMNNTFVQRQAERLAERARRESGGDLRAAVARAYWLALGRAPTRAEVRRAEEAARERSLTNVCWVLLNSSEFVYVP